MKKVLGLLMALLLLSTGFALAEDESAWDFDTYDFSLEGYTGTDSILVIPDMIQGCTVDMLGVNAFNSAAGITSITLPETLRQIEDGAISFCDDLTEITLNDGLLIIGDNCFVANPLLTEITIPASVCYIGRDSFCDCEGLTKVVFEGECPVFAGTAFDWLSTDTVIYVPDDQYDAYLAAFEAMELYITLQPSGSNAVVCEASCVPEQFGFDAETGTIFAYEGFDVRVDIPAEIDGVPVRGIDAEAFLNMNYLCYLTIPEGVEVIGDSAFENCTRLLHIEFPSTLKHIGSRAFAGGMQAWNLYLPEGLESIGSEAFDYAVKLSGPLALPEGLKTISERAFANCYWLEEVSIPASVERIGENAFVDSGLSYVVFEGLELPEMADNVFSDCDYLMDIDLHTRASKQQMLDMQAIVNALGLDCRVWRMQNPDVDYIYDGLDIYENGVMTGYTGEQTHVRPWDTDYNDCTVTMLGDGAFRGNSHIEYFSVPYNDEFTTIGAEAFADSSLAKIDLFDSVTTINGGAFRNCVNLTELTLPESVTFVGVESLNGCTNLQKLIVLCDPDVLPEDLLADCPADMEIYAGENATDEQLKYLTSIANRPFYLPVTRIGEALPELTVMPYEPLSGEDFWYDSDFARLDSYDGYELNLVLPREIDGVPLTMFGGSVMTRASYGDNYECELPVVSVVIPETYTEIVPYAFSNCETLETVICYAPIDRLPDCAFENCTSLREVIFVNGVQSIGEFVFNNCPNLETVYIGQYAEDISEFAFLSANDMYEAGEAVWSLEQCITDPALLPDIDAMLENVKREPMTDDEPELEPAPAVPVGEAGKPFLGVWHGTEIVMGDTTCSFADFEMTMTLLLSEDGRMVISESDTIDTSLIGEGDWMAWRVENGTAIMDTSVMTVLPDGRLCVDEDGVQMIFVRDEQAGIPVLPDAGAPSAPAVTAAPSVPVQPSGNVQTSDAAQRTGIKYVCVNADVSGFLMDAAMLGGEYSLLFHENGSADFVVVGSLMPNVSWKRLDSGNFEIDFYGTAMEVVWTDTGFDMNYMDAMLMHFAPAN